MSTDAPADPPADLHAADRPDVASAAHAPDGARTLDDTARVVARAHELERRVQRMADVLPTPEERAVEIVEGALRELGASAAIAVRIADDGARLDVVGSVHLPDDVRDALGAVPLDASMPIAEAARTGRPCYCESRAQLVARWPSMREPAERLAMHALAAVPVRHMARVHGAVAFGFAAPRRFGAAERAVLRALGPRYARALHASRRYYAEHDARTAETAARRTAEEARAVAEAAARAQGDYVAVVSHELRTPLQAILGFAELLTLGTAGALAPAQRDYVERIAAGGATLLQLVENLLGFSAAQIGRQRVDAAPFDAARTVAEVLELAEPLAAGKGLALRLELPDAPVPMASDQRKVRQIVTNLVGNAIKFTARGEVVVRVEAAPCDVVRIAVRDTGAGIAPNELPRLFEPFWQGAGRVAGSGGTGLGLSIVRQLARLLGGDVTVSSAPGAGATFTVELPATAPASEDC